MENAKTVTLSDVTEARNRIQSFVHYTPVVTSNTADTIASQHGYSVNLIFKCENLQKVGAFKFRGATNAIKSLLEAENRGGSKKFEGADSLSDGPVAPQTVVITHSSGNHAQAMALAARLQGVVCHVVMPSNAPSVKKEAVRGYDAIVTECEPTLQAREDTVTGIIGGLQQDNATSGRPVKVEFISPYDDVRVIAGQGTMALELFEQAEELGKPLDVVITPVGGGGMLSGVAVAAKGTSPTAYVIGAEPAGADDAHRSFYSKQFHPSISPLTVADGLLTSLGKHTFPLILQHVDAIFTVTEDQIIQAAKFVYERMKLVIEPSAAVPLAVVFHSVAFREEMLKMARIKGDTLNIGIVFSGGNVDLKKVVDLFD